MPNLNSHETPAHPDCAECVELTETQNRLAREHNLVRNAYNPNRVQHAADVLSTYKAYRDALTATSDHVIAEAGARHAAKAAQA